MSETDATWQKIRMQKEAATRRKERLEATRQQREEANIRRSELAQLCNTSNSKKPSEDDEKVSDYDRALRQVYAEVRRIKSQ